MKAPDKEWIKGAADCAKECQKHDNWYDLFYIIEKVRNKFNASKDFALEIMGIPKSTFNNKTLPRKMKGYEKERNEKEQN